MLETLIKLKYFLFLLCLTEAEAAAKRLASEASRHAQSKLIVKILSVSRQSAGNQRINILVGSSETIRRKLFIK